MAQELKLIMQTPVEQLIPAMLAWNNSELLVTVEEKLKQYEGITYDDSSISLAKKDRAQLNSFCTALNSERIRIGKVYSTPYDKFKSEVDEVIGRVKSVSEQIGSQIQAYELKKQQEKQDAIIEYFKEVIGEFSGCIPYERVHQSKWLNATTTMKSIKAEIDAVIENAKNAIIAIEALKSEDEATLKAFYFRTLNLSEALMENERLKQERLKIAELKAKQQAQAAAQEEVKPVVAEEPVNNASKTTTIKFQVEGTVAQLKALQQFLKENNIKYSAVKEDK